MAEKNSDSLGSEVKRLRLLAGLTQQGLADLVGCTQGTIGHIESGRNQTIDGKYFIPLCDALKISPVDLASFLSPGSTVPPPPGVTLAPVIDSDSFRSNIKTPPLPTGVLLVAKKQPAQKPKKHPGGRPRLDPTGVQVPQSVRLTPTEIDYLRQLGGSVNRGVQQLVRWSMERDAATTSTDTEKKTS